MAWWKQLMVVLLVIGLAYWLLSDDMLHTLKGKRVLVTGSSDGIGEQMAYHYARLGASVVVTARRLEKLNMVVEECQRLSPTPHSKHLAVQADMSRMGDAKTVVEQAIKHMGGLDILVLNHVKGVQRAAFEGTQDNLEELDAALNVNFRSYVHLTTHSLSQLVANNGSIIIVNSLAGIVPPIYYSSYSACKKALNGFFHSLRSQFVAKGQNVSVTSCYLGLIGTSPAMKRLNQSKSSTLKEYILVPASPNDTALDIIVGGARRQDQVFTPYFSARPIPVLYAFFPSLMEALFRYAVTALDA